MKFRHFFILIGMLGFCAAGYAQSSQWSLLQCIDYARNNSLSLKQAEYNVALARATEKQSKMQRLPSLNGSAQYGYSFGRTIDPTTNAFLNQSFGFAGFSVNSGAILYAGNSINNSIKQSKIDLEAAKLDGQASSNDLALQVASAYLNILLSEEQQENAEKRLEQSRRQLAQTDKFIQAGTLPANDRLDFVAQIARDEQSIIDAQNLVNAYYLNLKQLMLLDPNQNLEIVRPDIDVPADMDPNLYQLEDVYQRALQTQPQIKASDLRVESAHLGESIARSNVLPTLSINGSLSSNYSNQAKDFANPIDPQTVLSDPTPVVINGSAASVQFFDQRVAGYPDKSFADQINENFGQGIGISLQVPIYNNYRNKLAMERARLSALTSEVSNQQARQQLKTDVQRAIADSQAAKLSYEAAQRTVEAAQAAFGNAQRRFDLGVINTLEYATAGNTLEQAKVSLIQSKYQYIFNTKVVDFYLGKEIRL